MLLLLRQTGQGKDQKLLKVGNYFPKLYTQEMVLLCPIIFISLQGTRSFPLVFIILHWVQGFVIQFRKSCALQRFSPIS